MANLYIQDKKRRILFKQYETTRAQLKAIAYNDTISEDIRLHAFVALNRLPKNSSITRLRNRCVLTGRPRAVYQVFKLSRISFRELASHGKLSGVTKSSW